MMSAGALAGRFLVLVLARGPGQSIVLDNRITVTVLTARGSSVRLGIEAPPDVGVRRGELGPATTVVLRDLVPAVDTPPAIAQ